MIFYYQKAIAAKEKIDSGKCPGAHHRGCKYRNNSMEGRIFCFDCQKVQDDFNSSDAHYKALANSNRASASRPNPVKSFQETIQQDVEHFGRLLQPVSHGLHSKRLVVWDTEHNGVGGSNDADGVRELVFLFVDTKDTAALTILDIAARCDYLVAFERGGCGRNRALSLLGNDRWKTTAHKFINFDCEILHMVATTNEDSGDRVHIWGRWWFFPRIYGYYCLFQEYYGI
ncbi:hypothetical protein BC830DRAFT_1103850 [Chytriomyces sp. MP71]|nr:hypothetical protein BC830DRAFT_1103850 [Chytriomyces sp. MP71]